MNYNQEPWFLIIALLIYSLGARMCLLPEWVHKNGRAQDIAPYLPWFTEREQGTLAIFVSLCCATSFPSDLQNYSPHHYHLCKEDIGRENLGICMPFGHRSTYCTPVKVNSVSRSFTTLCA